MTTTATDTPDGERLARLEIRVEHLGLQNSEIREDIRELREDIRALRAEHREDFRLLAERIQRLESQQQENFQTLQSQLQVFQSQNHREMEAQRSRADKQFLWVLGIVITMWVSIIALGATAVITMLNRLGA